MIAPHSHRLTRLTLCVCVCVCVCAFYVVLIIHEHNTDSSVGPVAVGDVRVVLEGHRDLLVGVEADAAGHQDRPLIIYESVD